MFPIGMAGRMHLSSAFVQSVQPTLGNPNMQPAVFLSHTWVPLQRRRFGHGTKWTWLMPVLGSAGSGFLRRSTRASGARASWVQKAHAEHVHMDRFRFPTGLLEQGRQSMEQALSSDSIIYLVRSYGRASSFRRMTCGLLEQLLPLNSCRLVLAADDPDLDIYKTNSGPWENRIIMGVKGAERQIAFIDQISRVGSRLSWSSISKDPSGPLISW